MMAFLFLIKSNLNNYFDFHVCLSFRPFSILRPCVQKLTSIPAVVQQNVMNKSCLVCVMSEKYAFWITLRPQSDRCRRGEAEVRILDFKTTWSEFQKANQTATKQGNAERISKQNVCSSPQSRSKAVVCVSRPRMYPRSGYFLVSNIVIPWQKLKSNTKSLRFLKRLCLEKKKSHILCQTWTQSPFTTSGKLQIPTSLSSSPNTFSIIITIITVVVTYPTNFFTTTCI